MNKTIRFFEEISQIPRESGNEKAISNYLINFAQERNLEVYHDIYHNVLIKKITSHQPIIILQAHTDMVCVSNNPDFDFASNPIEIIESDGYLSANNTTLGADNGIGIAQILNILDSNLDISIEALFTATEETTMQGAMNFDKSLLQGKIMLNLDGFNEFEILCESASFYDLIIQKETKFMTSNLKNTYQVSLFGLEGGHSGANIQTNQSNAVIFMGELLSMIPDVALANITGGTKNNVIPSSSKAIIKTNLDENQVQNIINDFLKTKKAYPNLNITLTPSNAREVFSDSKDFISFITNIYNGIQKQNERNEVTTSLNLGFINNHHLEIGLRSSQIQEATDLLNKLKQYTANYQFQFIQDGFQPGFYTPPQTPIIDTLIKTCPVKPKITSVHITVEAGFFQQAIPNLQLAIISPLIENAHSTSERVNIKSIENADIWLKNFLLTIKKD